MSKKRKIGQSIETLENRELFAADLAQALPMPETHAEGTSSFVATMEESGLGMSNGTFEFEMGQHANSGTVDFGKCESIRAVTMSLYSKPGLFKSRTVSEVASYGAPPGYVIVGHNVVEHTIKRAGVTVSTLRAGQRTVVTHVHEFFDNLEAGLDGQVRSSLGDDVGLDAHIKAELSHDRHFMEDIVARHESTHDTLIVKGNATGNVWGPGELKVVVEATLCYVGTPDNWQSEYGKKYQAKVDQFIADYVPSDTMPDKLSEAEDLGLLVGTRQVSEHVSDGDRDVFTFKLPVKSNVTISLTGLMSDADVELLDESGNKVAFSDRGGSASENIDLQLQPGRYFVRVVHHEGGYTPYDLKLTSIAKFDFTDDAFSNLNFVSQLLPTYSSEESLALPFRFQRL